ncbi:olfactory receptor 10Z1-like [Lacerta agilis]|uniref:olfactory receptor 10Z1-like n=1 Tax=Lacerta agilis TaxID=80427 RepID=UPI001419BDFE|nr:olfactory receptor 10Z1-like [Lacerta agilis]
MAQGLASGAPEIASAQTQTSEIVAKDVQENQTRPSEFLLIGLSDLPQLRFIILAVFLFFYLLTLSGNVLLGLAVWKDTHLQTPMYILLCSLALSETFISIALVPKALTGMASPDGVSSISFPGCVAQMFFASSLASTNCFLLAAMGYDRSVAVRDPLHYVTRMGGQMCTKLISLCTFIGFCVGASMTTAVFHLPFCPGHNRLQHFFCDIPPLLDLACADTHFSEVALLLLGLFVLGLPLFLILLSYTFIMRAVLRVSAPGGRQRAFSTCGAHLTVVVIHFGCASFIYLRPKSSFEPDRDRLVSVGYCVVTPLLNPMVYSLRNREVHAALKKTLGLKVAAT